MKHAANAAWIAMTLISTSAAVCLGGCASLTYAEPDGSVRVIGFVSMKLPPPAAEGVQAQDIETLGLAVRSLPEAGTSLALGYNRDRLISLPANACLDLRRSGPCTSTAPPKTRSAP